uniref:Putative lipocalin lipocalin n=1 Tax=Rhipicephalus microplus TaxID=6941 RepID=A0A6G5A0T8_RHIMP
MWPRAPIPLTLKPAPTAMHNAINILVFALVVSALQYQGNTSKTPAEEKVYDFRKFVTENKKIWTYESSDYGRWRCKLDNRWNITNHTAFINRSYYMDGKVSYFGVEGYFGSSMEAERRKLVYNMMSLYDHSRSRNFHVVEKLRYMNENNTCAVIEIWMYKRHKHRNLSRPIRKKLSPSQRKLVWFSLHAKWVEVRIPYRLLGEGIRDCFEQFKMISKEHEGRIVSREDCLKYYPASKINQTKKEC